MIYNNWANIPVLLRTYYSPDPSQKLLDGEKMEQWANAAEMLGDHIDWACLNDEQFNFGSGWQRVYEIMPEITGPMDGSSRRKQDPLAKTHSQFKEALRERRQSEFDEWKKNPQQFIQNTSTDSQFDVTAAYILIADQEAFQSDHLRLLYVDYKLNVVRESRVQADGVTITDVIMDWDQTIVEPKFWEQGIGEKYRVDGELGTPLYQLAEEDWADPDSHEVEVK